MAGILIDSQARKPVQPNRRQMFHRDYNAQTLRFHRDAQVFVSAEPTFPWTLLLMLSAPGFVYVSLLSGTLVKIFVPLGCAVLFRGDVLHAGAAYQHRHVRAHWYLTPVTSPFHGITSPAAWRENDKGHVALFDEDPTGEWEADTTAFGEPVGVVPLPNPYIHSIAELVESPFLKY